jgi:hypothetical protein
MRKETHWQRSAVGVVHANVGQSVTPHNPSLGLFLYHFFTYDELVTSRVNPQQHKQPTNTTTMVMVPLAPQQSGFDDIMLPKGQAALRMFVPRPLLKDFV